MGTSTLQRSSFWACSLLVHALLLSRSISVSAEMSPVLSTGHSPLAQVASEDALSMSLLQKDSATTSSLRRYLQDRSPNYHQAGLTPRDFPSFLESFLTETSGILPRDPSYWHSEDGPTEPSHYHDVHSEDEPTQVGNQHDSHSEDGPTQRRNYHDGDSEDEQTQRRNYHDGHSEDERTQRRNDDAHSEYGPTERRHYHDGQSEDGAADRRHDDHHEELHTSEDVVLAPSFPSRGGSSQLVDSDQQLPPQRWRPAAPKTPLNPSEHSSHEHSGDDHDGHAEMEEDDRKEEGEKDKYLEYYYPEHGDSSDEQGRHGDAHDFRGQRRDDEWGRQDRYHGTHNASRRERYNEGHFDYEDKPFGDERTGVYGRGSTDQGEDRHNRHYSYNGGGLSEDNHDEQLSDNHTHGSTEGYRRYHDDSSDGSHHGDYSRERAKRPRGSTELLVDSLHDMITAVIPDVAPLTTPTLQVAKSFLNPFLSFFDPFVSSFIAPYSGGGGRSSDDEDFSEICCADCPSLSASCLSKCKTTGCFEAEKCADAGKGAYAAFCQSRCEVMMGMSFNSVEFLPDEACRGYCSANVQKLCAANSCEDHGCYAAECAELAALKCL
eukprot:GHVS01087907.1.p1 GENE.GHVS01087907.1~~GHVS01087907.1.p1  ORF type:complete len:604 (-),score=89.53 GHVS01087907.1:342-2153(-)